MSSYFIVPYGEINEKKSNIKWNDKNGNICATKIDF